MQQSEGKGGQKEGQPWRGWMQRGLKMKIGMPFVLATR